MQRLPPPTLTVDTAPDHDRRHSLSTSTRTPSSPRQRLPGAPSPTHAADDDERWQLRSSKRNSAGAGLPLYSSAAGAPAGVAPRGGAGGVRALLGGRLRGGRARWMLLVAVVAGVLFWQSRGRGEIKEVVLDEPLVPPERAAPVHELAEEKQDAVTAQQEALPVPGQPKAPPPPAKAPPDTGPIDVVVRPEHLAAHTPADPAFAGRYLAYSPHSGYHNQRISLENALTLAYLLKRTLLLPPVWLGHAIPYISFSKLQRRLEMASKEGLEHCIEYGEGTTADPIPRECDGFWDWTLVDWSFLVNLDEAEKLVPIQRRWNMSMAWLEDELDLCVKPTRGGGHSDVYSLQDDVMYQYRFYDSRDDDDPLDKWTKRIDIDELRAETDAFELVHVGTMFGTNRMRVTLDEGYDARGAFRKAMVFRTELVDEVTAQVRDQLGGEGKYYGLHLRVGDGIFQKNARDNMRGVWDKLCIDKMKQEQDVCDEMRERSEQRRIRRRDLGLDALPAPEANSTLVKRANSRPQREGAYHHAPLPPLPKIRTLADSPISSALTCRGSLHTDARFLPFNAPVYIATDSKVPHDDPNLAVFFDSFPCTFVLGDFGSLPALGRLNRLRNKEDKTPLAQFLYPQLDAQIAAWGRGLVGTPQSTYSRFAIDVLHQVYHGWDIVERG
ncbi:hypothetical protein Rhopal_000735-T1 [Rhodotorula paludigena]|uniref:CigA protein n=1 Tax=Rhodotorula paludigena TaxID=86838 RepID=A0AAV5GDQ2_9BASI|nr:hypothetical protein Rhopal_000735-T1 [Rhodotorula paludigena]